MNYPIYRKYKGIDVYFKIESETEFVEYKKMGSRLLKDQIMAKIFPEKQFIQDMINLYEDRWIEVSEIELLGFIK
jgi:hypothetical protein